MVPMRTAMLVRAVVHVQTGRRSASGLAAVRLAGLAAFQRALMLTHDHAAPGSFTGQFMGLRRHF